MSEQNEASDERQDRGEGKEPKADEEWKESVARERDQQRARRAREASPGDTHPDADMRVFLGGIYTGALMSLGEIENPVTSKREKNLREATYLIDTLAMLKDKTRGNLTEEEARYLDNMLHDLRMRYVGAVEQPTQEEPTAEEPDADSESQ